MAHLFSPLTFSQQIQTKGVDKYMVTNLICDACKFQPKCIGYNKLKPFTKEGRTDLGIELEMQKCNVFVDMNDNDEDAG